MIWKKGKFITGLDGANAMGKFFKPILLIEKALETMNHWIAYILSNVRSDFVYIYDGDYDITPQTGSIEVVSGNFHENFVSRSNTLELAFISGARNRYLEGARNGFNISIDTGMNDI